MQKQFLTLSVILFCICGCSYPKSAMDDASVGNGQIPTSFNPSSSVLLIEEGIDDDKSSVSTSTNTRFKTDMYMNHFMMKNNENMIEYVNKNYQYKHEFASQADIYNASSKYSDKTSYQYALVTSLVKPSQHMVMNPNNGQLGSTHDQPIFKFYLYDRLNNKTYAALGHGSSLIMWAFKSAIKKVSGNK